MKKALLFALTGSLFSMMAQASVVSLNDSRTLNVVPQNSRIYFGSTIGLSSDSESLQLVDGGSCLLQYSKIPVDVLLTGDTPLTVSANNDGTLYGSVDASPLSVDITLSCAAGTTLGQLQRELLQVGAQLLTTK